MESRFKNFILRFIMELKNSYGFNITTDMVISLFQICGEYDIFDEQEIKNASASILCQNQEEYYRYSSIFDSCFNSLKGKANVEINNHFADDIIDSMIKKHEEIQEDLIREESEFQQKVCGTNDVDNETKELLASIVQKIQSKDEDVLYNVLIKDGAQLYKICSTPQKERSIIMDTLEKEFSDVMTYVIENVPTDIMNIVIDAFETLQRYLAEYKTMAKRHEDEHKNMQREIKKMESKVHRDVYIEGHNAVQADRGYLYKDFSRLDDKDLDKISGYIKRNAVALKTRIAKSIKKKHPEKLDYKKTIKNAVRTDMIPMELFYKKKKKEQTKIICITDISGSCKNASQILMTFIYALQEAFPGGVESYVFVKQLKEATSVFRNYSLKEANERASVLVERNYSNYYEALRQFDAEYFHNVTKDSIVIYLGDARNNNNKTGCEFLEKVRKKIKAGNGKMYWINPEPKTKWDSGDSIISEYEKYMDKTVSVQSTNDLIKFLSVMF